ATMRQSMQNGFSKAHSIERSIALNFMPILITSITTAIGFLMMNMSDSPILRDFGNLSALGVMIACFLSITLLPALLHILPVRVKSDTADERKHFMDHLGDFVVSKRHALLPLSVLVIVASASLIPLNKVNEE
ncbi:MMPL family transporter, partial [Vibrio parahaemolyticus]|uniref:MMPL family transporter n=1 Tax=Vibrio parahaemolyticus TaxID=670 RepID=UPI00146E16A4